MPSGRLDLAPAMIVAREAANLEGGGGEMLGSKADGEKPTEAEGRRLVLTEPTTIKGGELQERKGGRPHRRPVRGAAAAAARRGAATGGFAWWLKSPPESPVAS